MTWGRRAPAANPAEGASIGVAFELVEPLDIDVAGLRRAKGDAPRPAGRGGAF